MRIFWLFNHPAPYKVEFFNRLGKDNDLTVYFERTSEGGRNGSFYSKRAETFHAIFGHPLKLGALNSFSFKPLKALKEHKDDDIIVLNGWRQYSERMAISYCKRHKIPYVFYINGGIIKPKENNIIYAIKSSYISGASLYLAPEPASKEYLLHYGAKEENIVLYPYGSIALDEVLPAPYPKESVQNIRKKLNIEGEKVFVSAGFFIKRKNFEALISLWPKMPKSSHLYLIGEGPEEKSYKALIQKYHLQNVHLLPYMDHKDLFRFYRACDAFVFPSHEDIYGHVVIEAMSQGLHVFSSKYVNAAKALAGLDTSSALLDFDKPDEVVATLNKDILLEDRVKAIEIAKRYTFEASAKAHQQIFEDFLAKKK